MTRVIVTPAGTGGALAELKRWLAIGTDRDDALLASQLQAALALFEQFTGLVPLQQTCEEVLGAERSWQNLSAAPVAEIVAVYALALADEARALEEEDYASAIGPDGEAKIILQRSVPEDRLLVRYTVGLAAGWENLDPGIRQGVIRLAAHYFLERGQEQGASAPASVTALWRPHRRLRLR